MRCESAIRGDVDASVRWLLGKGDVDGGATAVLKRLGPGVLGYLLSLLPGDEGYDAYSRFEEAVWKGLPGFRWESSLRAWAYRIAWRAAARTARDGYRRRREPLPPASALGVEPQSTSRLGRRDALERLRCDLLPEERTLLVLRVDRELGWDEVSAVLADDGEEISSAALRKRFERLKAKLLRLARESGLLA